MQDKMLTLKDIKILTGYQHIMTGYQKLRAAGVEPAAYQRIEGGPKQPVNLYRESDVQAVFADRIAQRNAA